MIAAHLQQIQFYQAQQMNPVNHLLNLGGNIAQHQGQLQQAYTNLRAQLLFFVMELWLAESTD